MCFCYAYIFSLTPYFTIIPVSVLPCSCGWVCVEWRGVGERRERHPSDSKEGGAAYMPMWVATASAGRLSGAPNAYVCMYVREWIAIHQPAGW